MAIVIDCPKCHRQTRVRDEFAGRRAKCPTCDCVITIPAGDAPGTTPPRATTAKTVAPKTDMPNTTTPKVAAEGPGAMRTRPAKVTPALTAAAVDTAPLEMVTAATLSEALRDVRLARTRPGMGYLLSLGMVAAFMLLLPLVYLSVIAGVGYSMVWHAVGNQWLLQIPAGENGRAALLRVGCYVTPFVMGGVYFLSLMKPFLARASSLYRPRALRRQDEPVLFEFVETLCQAIGAPCPKEIHVDMRVNASAGFRSPWLSLVTNQLVLTMGLPLVAGLPLNQLTGILAHEFGHFSQFFAMRFGFLIETINRWLATVTFQRDEWDRYLETACGWDFRVAWMFWLARLVVWLNRQLLYGLMLAGVCVSRRLSRQMEFDADRYAARLVGSQVASEILPVVETLGYAENWAIANLAAFHQDGQLVDNLPRLTAAQSKRFLETDLQLMAKRRDAEKTEWYNTHPATEERLQHTLALAAPGEFSVEAPATVLFADFDLLARTLTAEFYEEQLGKAGRECKIRPVAALISRQEAEDRVEDAAARFVGSAWSASRSTRLPASSLAADGQVEAELLQELRLARREMFQSRGGMLGDLESFDDCFGREALVEAAWIAVDAGLILGEFRMPDSKGPLNSRPAIEKYLRRVRKETEAIDLRLNSYEEAWGRRLHYDLRLAVLPKNRVRLQQQYADLSVRIDEWLPLLFAIEQHQDGILQLLRGACCLDFLLECYAEHRGAPPLIDAILKETARLHPQLMGIREEMQSFAYPFEHPRDGVSVGVWALRRPPALEDPPGIAHAANHFAKSLQLLKRRVLGGLMEVAQSVEDLYGLRAMPPLEDTRAAENVEAMDVPEGPGTSQRAYRGRWLWGRAEIAAGGVPGFFL